MPPIPHLGAISSLLTIIAFVALSAIASWLQKRDEQETGPTPPRPRGVITPLNRRPGGPPSRIPPTVADDPQPPTMDDWEKQIRRWVGEPAEPQPIPPRPPLPSPPPPIVRGSPQQIKARKVGPDIQLKTLTASKTAYKEGAEMPSAIATRMRGVDTLTKAHVPTLPPARQGRRSPEGHAAISLVKHHKTIRQSLLASIILGAPKSLE